MSEKNNIVKIKRTFHLNIGVVIFSIIIIYVLFNIFFYLTRSHIAKYQVQQGTIATNHVYTGLILRDETVEYAEESGYVDYYAKNLSKVSVRDLLYSIDTVGSISDEFAAASGSTDMFSEESTDALLEEIDGFLNSYDSNDFGNSYSFLNAMNSQLVYSINSSALAKLTEEVEQAVNNQTFFKHNAAADGVVVYEMDGFEGKTVEDILENGIDVSSYEKTYLTSHRQVNMSEPVYKLINSERWEVLLPIEEKLAEELNEKTSVKIRFCKDDFTTTAESSVLKKNGEYYLKLSLKTAMIRYANERFVDIELVMKETNGLKIPVSAITEKEFFTIPKEYFTEGEEGLLIQKNVDGEEVVTLVTPTIFFENEDYYYVDADSVASGDVIRKPESNAMYIVGTDTGKLMGVYNVNKGYAVFKQINILYESKEYAIVETKTAYGISLYDHIVLDASKVEENQLVTD